MKIIDNPVEEFLNSLKQGQVVRYRGRFLMVTNLTNEDEEMEMVNLETGEMTSLAEDELIASIDSQETDTLLVTESELRILKYFK